MNKKAEEVKDIYSVVFDELCQSQGMHPIKAIQVASAITIKALSVMEKISNETLHELEECTRELIEWQDWARKYLPKDDLIIGDVEFRQTLDRIFKKTSSCETMPSNYKKEDKWYDLWDEIRPVNSFDLREEYISHDDDGVHRLNVNANDHITINKLKKRKLYHEYIKHTNNEINNINSKVKLSKNSSNATLHIRNIAIPKVENIGTPNVEYHLHYRQDGTGQIFYSLDELKNFCVSNSIIILDMTYSAL